MSENNITLVGLPGAGKSTWGKLYAKKYNLDFYDLDDLIIKNAGTSIKDIISEKGELYFRKLENKTLIEFLESTKTPFLLASGGGTPCFYNNIKIINKNSLSIFLDVSISEILKRMEDKEVQLRPLFKNKDVSKALNALYEKRLPYYMQAKKRIINPQLEHLTEV